MADPNSCETCRYRQDDTGSGWCYMFREQPEPLCMQHQDRKPKRRVGTIGHVGGSVTLTAAVLGMLQREASKTVANPDGVVVPREGQQ